MFHRLTRNHAVDLPLYVTYYVVRWHALPGYHLVDARLPISLGCQLWARDTMEVARFCVKWFLNDAAPCPKIVENR